MNPKLGHHVCSIIPSKIWLNLRILFEINPYFKDWSEKDGGTLDLFDRDANGDPKDVVKRLVPKNNSLAFFEVTEKSFHQVAEVLTKDKQRLSVGEWKNKIVKQCVGKLPCYQVYDCSNKFQLNHT